MNILRIMLLQKALEYFCGVALTAGYMYYFDQNLITSLQEPTLLIALGEALLAWVNIYTIGLYPLFFLPSLVAYLLGLRAPHVLALLNAVGGITWSLVWIIGGKLSMPSVYWLFGAVMVLLIFLIGLVTYRQLKNKT